jgi:hypothetical protein
MLALRKAIGGKTRAVLAHRPFGKRERLDQFADLALGRSDAAQCHDAGPRENAMTTSNRDVATTEKAWRQAKRDFRKAFGDVARAYI